MWIKAASPQVLIKMSGNGLGNSTSFLVNPSTVTATHIQLLSL